MCRKKLNCCARTIREDYDDVRVPQVQKPSEVVNISADTDYMELDVMGRQIESFYQTLTDNNISVDQQNLQNADSQENPYMGLSSSREPENQYQFLNLEVANVSQNTDHTYEYPDFSVKT